MSIYLVLVLLVLVSYGQPQPMQVFIDEITETDCSYYEANRIRFAQSASRQRA